MQFYICCLICSTVLSSSFSMETRAGVLELLLVSAEGLKHAHHLRRSKRHYVTIQCGCQFLTSKITQGKGKKVWWNEKFRFPLSDSECRDTEKITLTIMARDRFAEDSCVGETKVYVGEIIREGSELEFLQVKPASYNVVLEDGTYKGALKLGIKFISSVSLVEPSRGSTWCPVAPRQPSIGCPYRWFLNFALPSIPWRRIFFFCTRSDDGQGGKKDP